MCRVRSAIYSFCWEYARNKKQRRNCDDGLNSVPADVKSVVWSMSCSRQPNDLSIYHTQRPRTASALCDTTRSEGRSLGVHSRVYVLAMSENEGESILYVMTCVCVLLMMVF